MKATSRFLPPPPAPELASTPAAAALPKRTPEETAERVRAQAELERRQGIEAKQRRDMYVRRGVAGLRRRWPDLFTTPVPLAVGVKPQIRAAMPGMPAAQLKDVLHYWTHTTAYLLAVATGVERRNLDGSPAGVPAEDQQEFAREALRRRGKWPMEGVQEAAEAPAASGQPGGDPA